MAPKPFDNCVFRFGVFELDPVTGELRRDGQPVSLQPQPARVLALLASRPGELISRDELQREIWGEETFVDFEHGVNFCVSRIRAALRDDAETPRFVETLPRRGYRFVAPVKQVKSSPPADESRNLQPANRDVAYRRPQSKIGSEPRSEPKSGIGSGPGFGPGPGEQNPRNEVPEGLSLAAAPKPHREEPELLPFPLPKPIARRSRVLPWSFGIVALALVAVGVYRLNPTPPPRVQRIRQLTHFGRARAPSYAATDGARIYFSEVKGGRYAVDQVSVAGGEPTPIPLPFPNAEVFDISPDHTELLVASFAGLEEAEPLWIVPVTGGAPRRLGDALGSSAAWSPDGQTIAFTQGSDLYTVSRDGNTSRRLVSTPAANGSAVARVRWSPSGQVLRFTIADEKFSQWEVSADGSNLHPLPARPRSEPGAGDGYGSWTPDGRYFVYRSLDDSTPSIWAIREPAGVLRRPSRKPVELYAGPQQLWAPLVSNDGKVVFFIGDQERRELVRYDSRFRQFVPYLSGIFARDISFSKDGQRVVYTLSPDFEVWLSKVDGSDRHPLTFPPMRTGGARWSPDGRQIAFEALQTSGAGGQGGVCLLPTEEGGKPELVLRNADIVGWQPDGESLIVWRQSETGTDPKLALYLLDLKTHQASLLPGSEGLHHGALSPDGLQVAALTEGNKSVALFDLQTHRRTELAKGAALYYPCWSHDGREVFFQDIFEGLDQPIYKVRIADRKVVRVTNFAQPFPADVVGYRLTGLTPDDSPLATLIRSNADVYALDVDFP